MKNPDLLPQVIAMEDLLKNPDLLVQVIAMEDLLKNPDLLPILKTNRTPFVRTGSTKYFCSSIRQKRRVDYFDRVSFLYP